MNDNLSPHPRASAGGPAQPFMERVAEAVEGAMSHGAISVQGVANQLHLTEQSLRRRLHKYAGMAPKDYFTTLQMQRAARLLADTPATTVTKVAEICGFESNSSFCHKFKRFFGCTPSQYRDSNGAPQP